MALKSYCNETFLLVFYIKINPGRRLSASVQKVINYLKRAATFRLRPPSHSPATNCIVHEIHVCRQFGMFFGSQFFPSTLSTLLYRVFCSLANNSLTNKYIKYNT